MLQQTLTEPQCMPLHDSQSRVPSELVHLKGGIADAAHVFNELLASHFLVVSIRRTYVHTHSCIYVLTTPTKPVEASSFCDYALVIGMCRRL